MQVIHKVSSKADWNRSLHKLTSLLDSLLFLISVTVKSVYLMNIFLCYLFLHLCKSWQEKKNIGDSGNLNNKENKKLKQ